MFGKTNIGYSRSFFSRFIHWQNYIHYLLLSASLLYSNTLEIGKVFIEDYATSSGFWSIIISLSILFFYYSIVLLVSDTVIHGVFWFLPGNLKWRD